MATDPSCNVGEEFYFYRSSELFVFRKKNKFVSDVEIFNIPFNVKVLFMQIENFLEAFWHLNEALMNIQKYLSNRPF